MSFIRKQFIDIIEMPEIDQTLLVKKFPMEDQEIQYGGVLVVRESQIAIFINEGKLADVFRPGTYKLITQTIPILTSLKNWDKFFESPFKSDVYFLNAKVQLSNGWGTAQPITVRDKEIGMVRVRAFGKYTYQVTDPKLFFVNVSGAVDNFTRETLEEQLRNIVLSSFTNFLAQSGVPFIDMASNQSVLADKIKNELTPQFEKYGLSIIQFLIENLNLPEELQKTIDAKISMGIVGNLNDYTRFQMANSIPLAAQNESGMAGLGASMGVGMAMAQSMSNMTQSGSSSQESLEEKLIKAKSLFNKELITQEEYNKMKNDILSKF